MKKYILENISNYCPFVGKKSIKAVFVLTCFQPTSVPAAAVHQGLPCGGMAECHHHLTTEIDPVPEARIGSDTALTEIDPVECLIGKPGAATGGINQPQGV